MADSEDEGPPPARVLPSARAVGEGKGEGKRTYQQLRLAAFKICDLSAGVIEGADTYSKLRPEDDPLPFHSTASMVFSDLRTEANACKLERISFQIPDMREMRRTVEDACDAIRSQGVARLLSGTTISDVVIKGASVPIPNPIGRIIDASEALSVVTTGYSNKARQGSRMGTCDRTAQNDIEDFEAHTLLVGCLVYGELEDYRMTLRELANTYLNTNDRNDSNRARLRAACDLRKRWLDDKRGRSMRSFVHGWKRYAHAMQNFHESVKEGYLTENQLDVVDKLASDLECLREAKMAGVAGSEGAPPTRVERSVKRRKRATSSSSSSASVHPRGRTVSDDVHTLARELASGLREAGLKVRSAGIVFFEIEQNDEDPDSD